MKGDKKILIVAVLLLLLAVSYSTYAIYKSSASGDATVNTAAWIVKVGNTDIVQNNTFTLSQITWATPTVGQNNKIAPGDHGTVDIVIDASGSEVAVDYAITLGTMTGGNSNFSITAHDAVNAPLTGTIPYASGAGNMTKTITLDVTWTALDNETANPADVGIQGTAITVPITVTATQNPNPAA